MIYKNLLLALTFILFITSNAQETPQNTIQIRSKSVFTLYRNCGNELSFEVPSLTGSYKPKFVIEGGLFRTLDKKGNVVIIPSTESKQVDITILNKKKVLGRESFLIKEIPLPSINIFSNGNEINRKIGMRSPGPKSIEIKAISDKSFAEFFPKDANYKVMEWTVMLVRGKRPVSMKKVKSESIDISNFSNMAKPGDRILIEVKKIERTNYIGLVENVNIPEIILNLILTD